jgi:hypothetical protein
MWRILMAGAVVADFLTGDWGVWRTVQQSILIVGERLVELDINDDGRACGRERRLHGVPRADALVRPGE